MRILSLAKDYNVFVIFDLAQRTTAARAARCSVQAKLSGTFPPRRKDVAVHRCLELSSALLFLTPVAVRVAGGQLDERFTESRLCADS